MTSSNDKSTNRQKVKSTNYDNPSLHGHTSTYQSTAMQIQVLCSFLTHNALAHLTNGVPSTFWLGISADWEDSQRMLERQALRWSALPVVPGAGRSVLVHVRTEGHCQSQRQSSSEVSIKFWVNSYSHSSGRCHLATSVLGEKMHSANVT